MEHVHRMIFIFFNLLILEFIVFFCSQVRATMKQLRRETLNIFHLPTPNSVLLQPMELRVMVHVRFATTANVRQSGLLQVRHPTVHTGIEKKINKKLELGSVVILFFINVGTSATDPIVISVHWDTLIVSEQIQNARRVQETRHPLAAKSASCAKKGITLGWKHTNAPRVWQVHLQTYEHPHRASGVSLEDSTIKVHPMFVINVLLIQASQTWDRLHAIHVPAEQVR